MVNSPLIRPAISWGGSFGGGTLDSHDYRWHRAQCIGKNLPTSSTSTQLSTNLSTSELQKVEFLNPGGEFVEKKALVCSPSFVKKNPGFRVVVEKNPVLIGVTPPPAFLRVHELI